MQNCICINLPQPNCEEKIKKKDTLLWRFGHFIKITKNAKNTIFQFSTRFLKIFQSTLVGLLYLIKNVKPSSTRTCPKPAWLLYPRLSNSPRKVYPMWRDSQYKVRYSGLKTICRPFSLLMLCRLAKQSWIQWTQW